MDDLVQWLGEQFDADALWAVEASRESGKQPPEGGVHWHWVTNESDIEITPDPAREEIVGEEVEETVSLRSRETWTSASGVGGLPQFALYADSVLSSVGGHVIRHDPAQVLREIAGKRAVLKAFAEVAKNYGRDDVEYADGWVSGLAFAVQHMAAAYSDRPGYREDWRPLPD